MRLRIELLKNYKFPTKLLQQEWHFIQKLIKTNVWKFRWKYKIIRDDLQFIESRIVVGCFKCSRSRASVETVLYQTGRASSTPERISRSGRFLASWNVFPGWNMERIFPPSKIVYTTSEKPPRCEIRCIKTGVHGSVQYNSGKWHALLGRVYTVSDILSRDALEIEAPRAHNPRLWTSTCFEAYLVNR